MSRVLARLLLAVLVVSATLTAQQPPPQQTPSAQPPPAEQAAGQPPGQPEQPIFRAGAELVRVDVSVTGRNDEPVTDLQASDFVVTEDEIPQTVETVQFIRLDGQRKVDNGESLEIRGTSQALVEAAKDDVRLFAIFLDDYHIDRHPTITIPLRRALESFVEQLQPTDLVVLMDPLTTLDSLRYTRDKQQLLERIQKFEGRRGELFPVRSAVEEAQLTQRNVWELRAGVSLSALEAIITHFGGIREGRKSVLFVSQGPPVGMPGSVNYPRLEAALQAANRGNVTVHVLDPRPLGSAPFGGAEALRRLASETGGRAIVNTNSPEAGLKDVMADASAYYLIGYAPTRQLSDGKFHRINVRVKRSGVRVTARRGYWAPTEAETNPEPAPPPDPALAGALRELVAPGAASGGPDRRVIELWVGSEPADYGLATVRVAWEVVNRVADDGRSRACYAHRLFALPPADHSQWAQGRRGAERRVIPPEAGGGGAQGDAPVGWRIGDRSMDAIARGPELCGRVSQGRHSPRVPHAIAGGDEGLRRRSRADAHGVTSFSPHRSPCNRGALHVRPW
jgi:VWFA-related protein